MAYSLGLTLYNLSGRHSGSDPVSWGDRPSGRLVWLHAAQHETRAVLIELARHLAEEDGVLTLLTSPDPVSQPAPPGVLFVQAPPDTPKAAQEFLAHWQPEIAVFSGGTLFPAQMYECAQREIPMLMVEARTPHLLPSRDGWYPGLVKSTLHLLRHIFVLDDTAARALRKAGAEPDQLYTTGRMEEASAALPYVERDRAALATLLATRPVWLAADVTAAELPHIVAAHAHALRLAHRLLLILVPADPDQSASIAAELAQQQDWHAAQRSAGEEPDPEAEVYITDATEYGLWYRLAPVTFLGGSLDGTGCSRNPMEPAALGSAILYGPRAGQYGTAFGRLGAARAARMVASGSDLAEALADLLSPDRAARQAAAAWAVVSEGSEATEQVLTRIRAIMDGEE